MESKEYKLWFARDFEGELFAFYKKPERESRYWVSDRYIEIDDNLFPNLTWEDEPLEVKLRPAITDLDTKAKEYAYNVTDNEELREIIVNAFKAGYNI